MRQAHSDAIAIVAQLVEQRIRNAWVAGSSPASGSKKVDIPCGCLLLIFRLSHGMMMLLSFTLCSFPAINSANASCGVEGADMD